MAMSEKEAFDRLTLRGGSGDPLLGKALRYLEDRVKVAEMALEELCRGINSSTSSESTEISPETPQSSPPSPVPTEDSPSKQGQTGRSTVRKATTRGRKT